MEWIIGGIIFYGLIILWVMLKYKKECRKEWLREWDRKCRIAAEREQREER